jgi:DNA mismatch endonuclease (patch repair protein)
VIFIHGCFWHGHNCDKGRIPKSRVEFWTTKIEKNKARDINNIDKLILLGWDTFVVWECKLKHREELQQKIIEFLENEKI